MASSMISKLSRPKLVMFDLDGTLVDSAYDLTASVDTMLRAMGRPEAGEAKVRDWVGNGAAILVQRALAGCFDGPAFEAITAAERNDGLQLFREDYRQRCTQASNLYPGVKEGLSLLAEAKIAMAIITNKPYEFTLPILASTGIDQYFSQVLGGDSLPRKKPEPDQLLHCMAQAEVTAGQSLMVGDSMNDIDAAKNAAVPVVAVSYGYNHGCDIYNAGADVVVDSIEDMAQLILS